MVDRLTYSGRVHQIVDFLYLSGVAGARRDNVRELGVTCVINCAVQLANLPLTNVEFVNVMVEDLANASISHYFDVCADKIEEHRLAGGKVLVHCMEGVSRSASIVIAYLVKYQNLTLREAYITVRTARNIVQPNPGFWKQLIEYECRLRKEESVRMVHSTFGMIPDVYEEEMTPRGCLKVQNTFGLVNQQLAKFRAMRRTASMERGSDASGKIRAQERKEVVEKMG